MTTKSALAKRNIQDYSHLEPLPDPPPREPDMWQRDVLNATAAALLAHYADRPDVLVCGDGYLRRRADESGGLVPDCAVAMEVSNPRAVIRRNGYVISEVGKAPDFVLEVASRSTGRRDYTVKREGYAGYGVQEYWRFDATGGRYHDAALAGDALVDGKYVPIEIVHEPDGRHWGYSAVLGLGLWWDNEALRFRDPETREYLPTVDEMRAMHLLAKERANAAEERADAETSARLAAEERLAEMEAELRRLRGE